MDAIYAGSEVTIIAAAGEDETYGLPGVGKTARSPQPVVRIGDCTVVSSMEEIHQSIDSSRWSTRGWTYQEAMLSRRRLVFTQDQLYFECDAMNCCESVSMSMDSMHVKDKTRSQQFIRKGLFNMDRIHWYAPYGATTLSPFQVFRAYLSAIEQYTPRQLRYDEDSLNAFQGIVRKFEKHRNPVFQIWGIPLIPKYSDLDLQHFFSHAICWAHNHSVWDGRLSPRRRPDFPSWSWAGWAGAVKFSRRHDSGAPTFGSFMRPISLAFESGDDFPLDKFGEEVSASQGMIPRHLRIEARVIPSRFISHDEKKGWQLFCHSATVSLSAGAESPSQLLEKLNGGNELHCVLAAHEIKVIFCFILATQGEVSSRVGLITFEMWYWDLEKEKAMKDEAEWKTFLIR